MKNMYYDWRRYALTGLIASGIFLAVSTSILVANDTPAEAGEKTAQTDESTWQKAKRESAEAAGSVGTATKETAGGAWGATKRTAGKAWGATKEAAGKVWDATKKTSRKAWDATKEAASDAVHGTNEGADDAGNTMTGE